MNFNLDSYVEIGSTHNICEDYILHGMVGNIPFVALSDGCSSSKFTDIGSRMLTLSFKRALVDFANLAIQSQMSDSDIFEYIHSRILFRLQFNLESLGLKSSVADATLIYSFVFNDKLYTKMYGDGNIMFKNTDGQCEQINHSYSDNTPYYLSYQLDYMRNKAYGTSIVLSRTTTKFPDITHLETIKLPYNDSYESVRPIAEVQMVSLFSDGIESFRYSPKAPNYSELIKHKQSIETPIYWVCEMTEYKNVNGEFVKRRMKRIGVDNMKNYIEHYDDVSVATIWVNHE
jgi:hypothetical protein